MNRIGYIDALKGLLILLVIIGHFEYSNYTPTIVCDIIYSFHMPMFIFISGYLVENISFTKLMKKLRSFLVPFFVVGVFYSFLRGDFSTWLFTDTKHYFWFLLVLAECITLTYILHTLSSRFPKERIRVIGLGGGFLCVMLFIPPQIISPQICDLLSFSDLCVYFPFFFLGHVCRLSKNMQQVINNNHVFTLSLIFYMPFQYLYMITRINYYHGGSAICAIIVLFYLFKNMKMKRIEEILSYFGKRSLDIYLFHGFVLFMFNLDFVSTWINYTHNYMIEIVISSVIAVVISLSCIMIGKIIKESIILKFIVYGVIEKTHRIKKSKTEASLF